MNLKAAGIVAFAETSVNRVDRSILVKINSTRIPDTRNAWPPASLE